jgi:DNA transformation protein and related proteins
MSEFTDYLPELFAGFGAVTLRRMFGGHGVYKDGLMFGLIASDQLYLKVDDQNRSAFTELGLGPFVYVKDGKSMAMSYFAAPAAIFDDPDEAAVWARSSFEAALRASASRRGPGRPLETPRRRARSRTRR